MPKYVATCLNCNYEMGTYDSPNASVETECPKCGGKKIGFVEQTVPELTSLEFDIVLLNKRTGVSKVAGFVISKDTVKAIRKDLHKIRVTIAEEAAKSLHQIIKSDKLLTDLFGIQ